jgi:hypothetical protein
MAEKHGYVYVAPPPSRGGGCGDNSQALHCDIHLQLLLYFFRAMQWK